MKIWLPVIVEGDEFGVARHPRPGSAQSACWVMFQPRRHRKRSVPSVEWIPEALPLAYSHEWWPLVALVGNDDGQLRPDGHPPRCRTGRVRVAEVGVGERPELHGSRSSAREDELEEFGLERHEAGASVEAPGLPVTLLDDDLEGVPALGDCITLCVGE